MKEKDKTKEQLITELVKLRKQKVELEKSKSQHEQTEKLLKESEEKYHDFVKNIHDVIFLLSPTGIIQYVSPKVEELHGYKPEELIGKHLKKTTPLSEVPKALGTLRRVLSGEILQNFEINQLNKKGKIVHVEINATPVRKNGKIIAIQGLMRDITQRIKAEGELRRHGDQLDKLVKNRTVELTKTNEKLRQKIEALSLAEEEVKASAEASS